MAGDDFDDDDAYKINGDGDASDFDHEIFGYLKWTDGLRSRWVPVGISYPESTRS